ncbi:MAG: hypothetical protein A3J83_04970 [Elusimicrobia bacterium RIFOXYA2_FULL_40_6]|nr:MAG: hypothetical protein A3J83_04970 [Elusimicrobia bacterium RIFOXYA2_FULL_40_6]
MKFRNFLNTLVLFLASCTLIESAPTVPPVYLSELPNINEYDIFANSGWDGNWYVGYNVCWIEKISNIPKSPTDFYRKAYIGAKLGRAKVRPVEGKSSWEKEPIPGDIYIGVSSTSSWKSNSRYFLASSLDMPIEGDMMNAQSGTGEARWFWAEVPIDQINLEGPNYIALWSPTDYFTARDTAPILCGGWGTKGAETNTWLNNEIEGAPPIDPADSLKTPISVFEPAIAMKLIPAKTEQEIKIQVFEVKDGKKGTPNKTIVASVEGNQIEKTWLEYATMASAYQRIGAFLYNLPWIFTLNPEKLPKEKIFVRVAAEDVWGNRGYSQNVEMIVK